MGATEKGGSRYAPTLPDKSVIDIETSADPCLVVVVMGYVMSYLLDAPIIDRGVPTEAPLMVTIGSFVNCSDTSKLITTFPTVVMVGWAVTLVIVGETVSKVVLIVVLELLMFSKASLTFAYTLFSPSCSIMFPLNLPLVPTVPVYANISFR